jgi:hypothetical protein
LRTLEQAIDNCSAQGVLQEFAMRLDVLARVQPTVDGIGAARELVNAAL